MARRVFRLDEGEVPDLEGFATKFRRKIMYAGAKVVALKARQLAPDSGIKRKGKLKRTIKYGAQDWGWEGYVKTKAPHAHLVHDGTEPHQILARTKESARAGWMWYRGSTLWPVRHPGAKAQPFLDDAAEQTKGEIEKAMQEKALEVAQEIAEGK